MSFTCPCNRGTVKETAQAGRVMLFRGRQLAVPVDLLIPTCDYCGEEWINRDAAARIDAALVKVYDFTSED